MTAKEMQIEFERRLQLVYPLLQIDEKPSSDTIFAFLNSAQERFVKLNYVATDQHVVDTNMFAKNVDAIKNLIVQEKIAIDGVDKDFGKLFKLPSEKGKEFFLYINSMSVTDKTYLDIAEKNPIHKGNQLISNQLIKHTDVPFYMKSPFNSPILRQPGVVLVGPLYGTASENSHIGPAFVKVYSDDYTDVKSIILTYCRKPRPINTISTEHTLLKSELAENVHVEVVELAVEMFVTEAKFRLATKPEANE